MEMDIEELKKKRMKIEKEARKYMDERNRLNSETKHWSEIRDKHNKEVRELLKDANDKRSRRDEINEKVKAAKEERRVFNKDVRELSLEVRNLKKKYLPKDGVPLRKLKKELKALEFKQQTSVLSSSKEKELVDLLGKIRSQIEEKENLLEENKEVRELITQLTDVKEKAETAHKQVEKYADEAQVEHDSMIELYNTVDEIRQKADDAQEKFVKAKLAADEAHNVYISYLNQIRDLEKMISGVRQQKQITKKKEIEEKRQTKIREVFDKLKSGTKLSTEDLMIIQKED